MNIFKTIKTLVTTALSCIHLNLPISVPAEEIHAHTTILPPPCFTMGMVKHWQGLIFLKIRVFLQCMLRIDYGNNNKKHVSLKIKGFNCQFSGSHVRIIFIVYRWIYSQPYTVCSRWFILELLTLLYFIKIIYKRLKEEKKISELLTFTKKCAGWTNVMPSALTQPKLCKNQTSKNTTRDPARMPSRHQ